MVSFTLSVLNVDDIVRKNEHHYLFFLVSIYQHGGYLSFVDIKNYNVDYTIPTQVGIDFLISKIVEFSLTIYSAG